MKLYNKTNASVETIKILRLKTFESGAELNSLTFSNKKVFMVDNIRIIFVLVKITASQNL